MKSPWREGMMVYFTHPLKPSEPESMFEILKGIVSKVGWPGTTNEYLHVTVHNSAGTPSSLSKKSSECFASFNGCRENAILKIYAQMERLALQLRALGDHTYN